MPEFRFSRPSTSSGRRAATSSDTGFDRPGPTFHESTDASDSAISAFDSMGQARDKAVLHGYLHAFADITRNNRVSARIGFTQRFLADANESGARFDDIIVSYTRLVPLPWKLKFRIVASLALPTSYKSLKIYNTYISPTGTLRLSRRFEGKAGALELDFRLFAGGSFQKYNTDAGGNPNSRADFGGIISLEYEFWFLRSLSIGVDAYNDYVWYYDTGSAADPNMTRPIATADGTFRHQPVQQEWGGEVFVRYAAPKFAGIHVELTFAYFHGDPLLGYASVNNDGVARVFPSRAALSSEWGQSSGFYGALDVSY